MRGNIQEWCDQATFLKGPIFVRGKYALSIIFQGGQYLRIFTRGVAVFIIFGGIYAIFLGRTILKYL